MTASPDIEELDVLRFLAKEARLLDDRRWDEWLDLWEPDGTYWVPVDPAATGDGAGALNHAYDDLARLRWRVARLTGGGAHTEDPPTRTARVVGAPVQVARDDGGRDVVFESSFVLLTHRQGRPQTLAGRYEHTLRLRGDAMAIVRKRVDLLNADSAIASLPTLL